MDDVVTDPTGPRVPATLGRRGLVRAVGTAVWAAPVVAVAAAAPAYALGSPPSPVVAVSGVIGRPPTATDAVVDASVTFTNTGLDAMSLSAVVNIRVTRGSFTDGITMVSAGWTVSEGTPSPRALGGFDYTFTRAGGIAAGTANAQTLTFRFLASVQGTGTITVDTPVTDPAGSNLGSAGLYL